MRQGWRPHQRMPPAGGKRGRRRGFRGRTPVRQSDIKFTPWPHITVTIGRQERNALLDSGSEISFVNAHTVNLAKRMGIHPQEGTGQIQLADGAPAQVLGTITLTIRVRHRPITHTFSILPTLTDAILIGIDLWARLGITLTPPCQCPANPQNSACGLTNGLATCTTDEDRRLQNFLGNELPKFQDITGPTPLITHHIRLTNSTPIKRYRPRNPAMQEIINQEVEDMEKTGVIEP
ncbi:reverse ribonuclease integrase, partial [Lasius niger]